MVGTQQEHSHTLERRCNRSPSHPRGWSLPCWAGRHGRSERLRSDIVVERIVERVALSGKFLVLTKMNYYD
jgi:hypothetical protein